MGNLTDIINKDALTGTYWEKAGKALLVLLDKAATQFVEQNKDMAIGLTEDEVKGILFNALLTTPSIPEIPEDASPVQLKAVASILKARASAFALTMEAQKARNINTAQLEANAKEFAADVGKTLLSAILGAVGGMVTK